ncbi:hypothetical protein SAE01_37500 [Segetibacter aerophilus]|uniref:Uncharacterized protein n=1 Tax=Segetibacter aerophilus TaxID=670293 RepID=A0A512BH07_9BACT|nr:hypothetical protein SAE01_37500 [Segetibacter aerophilus]
MVVLNVSIPTRGTIENCAFEAYDTKANKGRITLFIKDGFSKESYPNCLSGAKIIGENDQ